MIFLYRKSKTTARNYKNRTKARILRLDATSRIRKTLISFFTIVEMRSTSRSPHVNDLENRHRPYSSPLFAARATSQDAVTNTSRANSISFPFDSDHHPRNTAFRIDVNYASDSSIFGKWSWRLRWISIRGYVSTCSCHSIDFLMTEIVLRAIFSYFTTSFPRRIKRDEDLPEHELEISLINNAPFDTCKCALFICLLT